MARERFVNLLAHIHPRGELQPSWMEIKLTKALFLAAKIFSPPTLEHIIVAEADPLSMQRAGLLES